MAAYLDIFGKLNSQNHTPTSPETKSYNCIAWAAGDDQRWWQSGLPSDLGYYWPPDAPGGKRIDSLIATFAAIGYEICDNSLHSADFEKVALYAKADETWSHAARQLPTGKWTSKLGKLEDIEHDSPEVIAGKMYGEVFCYMARKAV